MCRIEISSERRSLRSEHGPTPILVSRGMLPGQRDRTVGLPAGRSNTCRDCFCDALAEPPSRNGPLPAAYQWLLKDCHTFFFAEMSYQHSISGHRISCARSLQHVPAKKLVETVICDLRVSQGLLKTRQRRGNAGPTRRDGYSVEECTVWLRACPAPPDGYCVSVDASANQEMCHVRGDELAEGGQNKSHRAGQGP